MTGPQIRHQPARLLSPDLRRVLLAFVLLALTLAVYAPVKQHPFFSIDDYGYVVDNFHIQQLDWDTVKWSFTTFHYANWDPLTWLSHALDRHFFALDAGRHHETSLLLHGLNVVLLFWLLSQATGYLGRSFAAAALFALHPINVEPVAWIAERKTLLSMVFFLATLIAYTWYARRPGVGRYLAVAVLFALALLSKPQVITLPCVLLLWDYWPLERIAFRSSPFAVRQNARSEISGERRIATSKLRFLLLEKLPLLPLCAASAIMTLQAQWSNRTQGMNTFSFASRAGNAVVSYVRYLGNAIWPTHLSAFYPHAHTALPAWQVVGALLLLGIITWLTLASRNHRYFAVGWLWFLGTLIPMIQLVQVGNHAMADRYAYLPLVGIFIAVCWGIADWAQRWRSAEVWLPAGTIAILLLLMFATRRQLSYWSDDLTLWSHSAQVLNNNWMAENLIGEAFLRKGDSDAAIVHFRAAAAMDPLFPFPHLHIGVYEESHGHPREAIAEFQKVIDLTQSAASQMAALRSNTFAQMSFAYNQLGDYANQEKYMTLAAQQRQP